jgi:hypothetical protein
VILEQFSNFYIIDTHGIVISERFFYNFVRSYKIYQMHFKPEEKKLTARLVLILLCHGPSCLVTSHVTSSTHFTSAETSKFFSSFILNTIFMLVAIIVTGVQMQRKRYGEKKKHRLKYHFDPSHSLAICVDGECYCVSSTAAS